MTRIVWTALSAAAALALGAASAHAANLVTNGDFEANPGDGSIASWTPIGSSIADDTTFPNGGVGHDAVFTSDGSTADSLNQDIATTPASSYVLSFSLADETGGLFDTFNVTFGGFSASFGGLDAPFGYTPFSFAIDGSNITAALTTLSFSGVVTDPAFGPWNLDDVSLEAVGVGGVPEPTAWALMLTGFFGTGALLRRRRLASAAAL